MSRRVPFIVGVMVAALLAAARPALADGARWAVIVQGASGDPTFETLHRSWVDALAGALRGRFGFDAAHLTVLAEQPKAGELRGTAENVRTVLGRLAKDAKAEDFVFVMLIGHGSGDGAAAKFNLTGPDLTVEEWSALLQPIASRVAVVDSTSSSFPFLAGLAGRNRVVITATNSYSQRYHTVFPDAFIRALAAPEADADKNGRISLLEAFLHASRLVALAYEESGHLSTETAALDDNGDGKGRTAAAAGDDGAVAALTYLDVVAPPSSADPEVQALLVRQQALVEQIDDLRRRRAALAPEAFDREFERLIVDLALVSRDVRRKTGKGG
jgi:hypothetical protein